MRRRVVILVAASAVFATTLLVATVGGAPRSARSSRPAYILNDGHVHLTNYIQDGIDARQLLAVMDDKVGRAVLFGIPLQQTWSYRMSGENAPTYYLESDADLYYYSFTDANIALAYRSLPKELQARFDPMITGFNPADMYAADHVRRVLELFPDTFVGIGEFSLHKEFVTAKIAGEAPSIEDPALDRLLRFAGEVGLVALVHCDIDTPFPQAGADPAYLDPMHDLFLRHPDTTFIWAHIGLGRVVRPIASQTKYIEALLDNPKLRNVHFDISWSETAKYLVSSPAAVDIVANMIERHPDRFLFGTDEVAPRTQADYLRVYDQYKPLWDKLSPDVAAKVKQGNYARIFDEARRKVHAWQEQNRVRRQILGVRTK
ncbi:MAG TPA: amidohydrolase family protein [Kofleriaceae bacterium]|nr:amidohydrolase family protein [Kofleriaceae bacterium]